MPTLWTKTESTETIQTILDCVGVTDLKVFLWVLGKKK